MSYMVSWIRDGEAERESREFARDAFALAKGLIDNGTPAVDITIPPTGSIIKGQAILDICDAIEGLDV